jgi:predicted house-cleaning noncanonical NTP pyrophosphatase (MazG superfamily)
MNSLAARKLEEYIESPLTDRNQEELYQLTTCLSEVIFTTYDTVVNDVIQQLYQPLPKIALA